MKQGQMFLICIKKHNVSIFSRYPEKVVGEHLLEVIRSFYRDATVSMYVNGRDELESW